MVVNAKEHSKITIVTVEFNSVIIVNFVKAFITKLIIVIIAGSKSTAESTQVLVRESMNYFVPLI